MTALYLKTSLEKYKIHSLPRTPRKRERKNEKRGIAERLASRAVRRKLQWL